ncbi:MAG TPA: tetratricopeptide repeat protein [Bryobacteraceae bacterium]|jgi:tetratricopeptide (TPR) repeat protein|nr:tetratricopeptide repeat protein [Bryobacteraceae bacterium]
MAPWSAIRILFLAVAIAGIAPAQSDRVDTLHAEASAAEASGDFATAIDKYREILKLDPQLAPAYNNLGALYVKQGRFADAADVLERGLKVDSRMSSARALLGLSLFQMGEYAKARPYLEAALKAHPADDNAEFLLVNDLTKLGEFNAAAEHLQRLAQRQPRNERVWYLLGRVYMQLGEQALSKMNEIDPNSVWAHQISAELMESMKNYNGAIVEYKKAIEVAPNQPGVHFKLGDLYWSLQQWDNATEQFLAEQKIDPRNCLIEYKLGDILVEKGVEMEEALKHVDKALAGCPNLTEARADRGRVLIKLHRDQEAIPELLAAEKANPAEASVHFLLVQAYRATGQAEQAHSEMKTFSELEQKSRNAQAERAGEVIQNSQTAH